MSKGIPYPVQQLEQFCAANLIGRKVVIVPSKQAGYNLTTWLARENIRWVNLRVETPLSLGEAYALPLLHASAKRRISVDSAHFLVHELLSDALDSSDALRRSLSAGPGLVRTMYQSIVDLRLAGVNPSDLSQSDVENEKSGLIASIYAGYTAYLSDRGLYDAAEIFRIASDAVRHSPPPHQTVAILDEVELPFLACQFVDALTHATVDAVRIGRSDFGVDVPPLSAACRLPNVPVVRTESLDIHPAGQIRTERLRAEAADRIHLRDAVGAEEEVRGVFREIRREEFALDTVEIVYTTGDPYVGLIAGAAATLDIPVTFATGLPLRLTRAGQAVSGFYRWIAGGLQATVLSGILRSRLVRFSSVGGSDEKVKAIDIAEVLDVRKAGNGRDELLAAFDRERLQLLDDQARGFGRNIDEKLTKVNAGRAALERLLNTVPNEADVSVSSLARSGLSFLKRYFRPAGESEALALRSVLDRLEELVESEATGSIEGMASLMHHLLARHRSGATVAREGHIYVVPVERAGYTGRVNTFVVGLDEASFPGGGIENPLLLDADRQRISVHLSGARARPVARTWALLRMLGALPGRVTLVANRFDILDGRDRYASSVYAQCREDLQVGSPIRYDSSFRVDEAISEADAWLAQRHSRNYFQQVALRYPMLAAGLLASMMRESADITRFDGYLGRRTPELGLREGKVLSATRLERLAECPHKYFLQYVLGVTPPDSIDPDDNRWLDALQFGKLVHELLYVFMTRLRERSERVDYDRHLIEIRELAQEMADAARNRIPPRTELAYREGLRRLRTTAEIFLAAESRNGTDLQPIEFEMRFGDGDEEGRNPRPIRLDLGGEIFISLRGSIDRVDRTKDGFHVWDYKTGSSIPYDRVDPFRNEKLQWALYAFAFEKMMEGLPTHLSVARSGYFFVGDKEYGRRISHPVPSRDVVGAYLAPLLKLVEHGGFVHFQKRDGQNTACRFCDYKSVCADERKDASSLHKVDEEQVQDIIEPLSAWMKSS